MQKRISVFLVFFFFLATFLWGQTTLPDSLKQQMSSADTDKKLNAHLAAYKLLRGEDEKQAEEIWKKGMALARQEKKTKLIGFLYRERAIGNYFKGEFDLALLDLDSMYQVGMAAKDSSLIGKSLDNMGGINFMKKDYNRSLESYLKGLRYYEGRED